MGIVDGVRCSAGSSSDFAGEGMQATMERIDVRRIRPDELMELVGLYRHLNADDVPPASDEVLQEQWQALIDDPKIHCLVAVADGILVGSCTLIIVPNITRGARSYALVENVVTHSACRRRGIGTRVLHVALQTAWSNGCYKVMLLTGSKRESTLQFYEQAGFKRNVKTGFIAYPDGRAP
jgi:GNAT superfamily N-acetyltransferase